MKEYLELRVLERHASLVFGDDEGERLGDTVRKVLVPTDDPRMPRIGELQMQMSHQLHGPFFTGWNYHRHYTTSELSSAELFHLIVTSYFEPAAEECDETVYDEAAACQLCGAFAPQVKDLRLDLRKLPKTRDISSSIASEVVVSQRLAELMVDHGITGCDLRPVRHRAHYEDDAIALEEWPSGRELLRRAEAAGVPHPTSDFWVWLNRPEQAELNEQTHQEYAQAESVKALMRRKPMRRWYQLVVTSRPLRTVPPTRYGLGPFDPDETGKYRCPIGHVAGLNILSEVHVCREDWDGSDVMVTKEWAGLRQGVLRPSPEILISPRFHALLRREKVKGFKVEIAYLH